MESITTANYIQADGMLRMLITRIKPLNRSNSRLIVHHVVTIQGVCKKLQLSCYMVACEQALSCGAGGWKI